MRPTTAVPAATAWLTSPGVSAADGVSPGPIPTAARSLTIGWSRAGGGSAAIAAPSSVRNVAFDAVAVVQPPSPGVDADTGVPSSGDSVSPRCCATAAARSDVEVTRVRPITHTSGVGELMRRTPAGRVPCHPGPMMA